jgi:hypothetical protein
MRLVFFILVFISMFGLNACEEILDTDVLPFEERLVISGMLRTDESGGNLIITKTLPLNIPFDTGAAFLEDVNGKVTSEGVDYPLEYLGLRGYYTIKGLTPEIGKEYELDVNWKDLHASAKTRIPTPIQLDSVSFDEAINTFGHREHSTNVWMHIPKGLSAEVAIVSVQQDSVTEDTSYFGTTFVLRQGSDEQVMVRLGRIVARTSRVISVHVVINTFAEGYYEYHTAKYPDQGDPFSNLDASIPWNVEGDGIGGFFGSCNSVFRYDF